METSIVVDISPAIPYLIKFWFVSYLWAKMLPVNQIAGFLKM